MNYLLKYIKYKNKYLELKQISGSKDYINEYKNTIDYINKDNINKYYLYNDKIDVYDIRNIRIKIISFDYMNKETFNSLIKLLEKNENDMCIYDNIKTQYIFHDISKYYETAKSFKDYKFIYLYSLDNLEEIKGYALINEKFNNVKELILLCSNKNYKNSGKYLLDYIYNNYIYKKKLLIIRPATKELKKYYVKWKLPIFPIDLEDLSITFQYLIYGDINLLKDNENSKKLIFDLKIIDSLQNYIIITDEELNDLSINDFKKKIYNKIKSLSLDESHKNHLIDNLNNVRIRTINELFI